MPGKVSSRPPDRICCSGCHLPGRPCGYFPLDPSLNNWDQLGDIQSGQRWISRSIAAGGRGVGEGRTAGTCEWNKIRLSRDIASAPVLSSPGISTARNVISRWAVIKNKLRSSCMSSGSLQEPVLMTSTTAWLSQWASTFCCLHILPLTMQAMTIGTSSFTTIERVANSSGQKYWNQCLPDHAPQPMPPEASVYKCASGGACQRLLAWRLHSRIPGTWATMPGRTEKWHWDEWSIAVWGYPSTVRTYSVGRSCPGAPPCRHAEVSLQGIEGSSIGTTSWFASVPAGPEAPLSSPVGGAEPWGACRVRCPGRRGVLLCLLVFPWPPECAER